ncbi:hypothetical protein M514_18696 [Trichuris suis]|uniref:Uncharacterized protein n=1 Tax=Trichuris suis TaxID=68888 RepID=A0A085NI23_9BILA|nr:hypothetical protein M514_18696 [Trichuris suis]
MSKAMRQRTVIISEDQCAAHSFVAGDNCWRTHGVATWNMEELDECTRQGDHFVLMIDLPKKRPPSRRCEPMNS